MPTITPMDVAIYGTLFERGLDPKKRSQLGAHYTDPATIMRIVTLQWRLQHGYPFKQNPVLEPLDHIACRDALLSPVAQATQVPSPALREREPNRPA